MKPDMRVQFAGIEMVNPVIAASGTFGYGVEFEEIVSFRRVGGLVTKGISREPMPGNQSPRLIETAAGMINAIGLQNIGVEKFLADKLPPLRHYPTCAVIVNVFGYTIEDYVAVIERLNPIRATAASPSGPIAAPCMTSSPAPKKRPLAPSSLNSRPTSHPSPPWLEPRRTPAPTPSPSSIRSSRS